MRDWRDGVPISGVGNPRSEIWGIPVGGNLRPLPPSTCQIAEAAGTVAKSSFRPANPALNIAILTMQ